MSNFYELKEWRKLRKEVLKLDKYECQMCKDIGLYKKSDTVHHINYVKLHPELALSKYYVDSEGNMKRNLVSLCHNCHEKAHNYRQKQISKPLTEERW